ncbi:hypothetical protein [Haliangium ochraceum]|uniref:Lipoprotein n=1 Tax=Haliangium ochraceum (strain DSM 14365 / JCM 11303 / SMP-2) TaxID=502025 RepID=D0LL27_HALO1|nr:hypothetical protein [Haliangium ochraceum]ACY16747.1 hypothetical protein Hoch_4250 [Haliangium ochraceum DSM 14365]
MEIAKNYEIVFVVLTGLVVGCGADEPTETDLVLASSMTEVVTSKASRAVSMALPPSMRTGEVQTSAACSRGGSLDVIGTVSEDLETFVFTTEMAITLNDCDEAVSDEIAIVLDGTLEATERIDEEGIFESYHGVLSYSGYVSVDDCAVDYSVDSTAQGSFYEGTMCGHDAATLLGPPEPR